jgi:methionyl-tRNA formyltransferase
MNSQEFALKNYYSIVRKIDEGGELIRNLDLVVSPQASKDMIQFAKKNSIPFVKAPEHSREQSIWRDWKWPQQVPYDLAIVVSFGYFLPGFMLSKFKSGTINVHPSLLPRFRGSSPIQYAILNDERETGVSIIELSDKKFDAGRILKQSLMTIPPRVYYKELHDMLGNQGGKDLVQVLGNLDLYQERAILQDPTKVTVAPKIKVSDAHIFWHRDSMEYIYRKFRAFSPRVRIVNEVLLYTSFEGKRTLLLSILDPKNHTAGVPLPNDAAPGTPVYSKPDEILYIKCKDGWIPCTELRVAGKKTTNARNFFNGYMAERPRWFTDELDP